MGIDWGLAVMMGMSPFNPHSSAHFFFRSGGISTTPTAFERSPAPKSPALPGRRALADMGEDVWKGDENETYNPVPARPSVPSVLIEPTCIRRETYLSTPTPPTPPPPQTQV